MPVHGVRRFLFAAAVFVAAAFSPALDAQYQRPPNASDASSSNRDWNDDIPAHISFAEGSVTLEREGRLEPAEANLALLAGDRLRTRGGRVEILFADGSALYLDENTELDLLADSLIRLLTGRLRLSIARTTENLDYRIDAPAASVWIQTAGEYRVEARQTRRGGPEVDLAVVRGSAELVNEHGRTLVRAGTHAVATPDLAPSLPYVTNSADWDEFDTWADRQRGVRVGTYSTRHLPSELRYYGGAFDNYGSWDYLPSSGYVWYPRVSQAWRPYSQGRWSYVGHFGWFWIGIDRWSWATHHYGRWGVNSGAWYWIPDRRWSPAWVSWGNAPGYVGWCPLGYDGRPVYGFRHVDPWSAWTILPSRQFVSNVWVTQHIVVHTAIPPVVRTQFVERPIAPLVPAIATPRVAPIHAPTFSRAQAVPRQTGAAYAGEEPWRSRTTNAAVPRNASSTGGGTAGARGSARSAAQPDTDVQRAVPDRTRVAGVGNPQMPRTEAPRTDLPRVMVPDRPATSSDDSPRATPRRTPGARADDAPPATLGASGRAARPDEPPQGSARTRPDVYAPPQSRPSAPVQRAEPERGPSRVPDRAEPRGFTPPQNAEPPRPSAPPPRNSEPDRGPSRIPDRAAPRESTPPPPAATPPPGRGRGGSESQAPPPSQGGDSRAIPRARGGGL